NKTALWLVGRVYGSAMINPPRFVTDHIEASDNVPELIAMGKDPLMEWGARADALYGLGDLVQHAWSATGKIKAPVLDLHGDHDQISPRKPAVEAAARLKPTDRSADYANV